MPLPTAVSVHPTASLSPPEHLLSASPDAGRPHQNIARNGGIVQSLEVPDAGVRVAGVVLGFSACGLEHGVGSCPLVSICGGPRPPECHCARGPPATTSSNSTGCMPPSATRRCPPSTAAGM